jgi:hypothetical protein
LLLLLAFALPISAQQSTAANVAVPTVVKYTGVLTDASGKPLSGTVGVTFLLYKDSQGGAPLWLETQSVQADKSGHYTVALGATNANGLPADVFASGGARWLAVQAQGQAEQPRTLLMSVPYAMKAADAETIGGLPPSAFVLAAPAISTGATPFSGDSPSSTSSSGAPPAASNVTTTGGTVNAIPLFTTAKNIQNSAIAQTGTGATAKIGIGTATPAAVLDVKGTETVRGLLTLPATGAATTAAGKNSQAEDFVASSFSSSTSTAVNQTFQLQAEPAANNTTNPSGTLNLLYGLGATAPSETGLKISNKGLLTFAAGQTFPGTGPGTVKSVGLTAPASDFMVSGSPVTGTGTLNFAWNVAPTSANTANAIIKRDGSGNFAGNTVTSNAVSTATLNATSATISSNLSMPSSVSNAINASASSGSATTIIGNASATTGNAWGVEGATDSSDPAAFGIVGFANSSTGNPKGVYGRASSANGFGVFGQNSSPSSTSIGTFVLGSGVWGDGGTTPFVPGVVGTSGGSYAGFFESNVAAATPTVEAIADNSSTYPLEGYNFANNTFCNVDPSGNLNCSGSKNAVVPIDSGKRMVAMSAIEAPQNWFEDAGEAELANGAAIVQLDSTYTQTVNADVKYQVFLTPYGDCKGLYVTNRTANSFEVRELGGGTASLSFGYRIMALRKNYETIRFADHTADMQRHNSMMERLKTHVAQPAPASRKSPIPVASSATENPAR